MAGESTQPVLPDFSKLTSLLDAGTSSNAGNNTGKTGGGLLKALGGVAGGVGGLNPVGAAAMGALAVGKGIAGMVKQRQADRMMPAVEDPEQRALASYAKRRKRAFQTGTAQSAQRTALREAMKTGIEKSFKVGGGAKGLNAMTRMFNQGVLGLGEQALAGESRFADMEKDQTNLLAQRQLELGLLKYNTEQARAAQLKKEGKSLVNLGLARAIGLEDTNPYGTAGGALGTTGTSSGTATTGTTVGNE